MLPDIVNNISTSCYFMSGYVSRQTTNRLTRPGFSNDPACRLLGRSCLAAGHLARPSHPTGLRGGTIGQVDLAVWSRMGHFSALLRKLALPLPVPVCFVFPPRIAVPPRGDGTTIWTEH